MSARRAASWAETDPDVLRCRRERAKRKNRVDPRLVEAERALAEQIQRDKEAKKGGRKRKPQAVTLRPMTVGKGGAISGVSRI